MKKSLAALAIAGLFAGASMSAFAADAQVYGVLDTGLSFIHADADAAGTDASDTFKMTTGQEFGSRWGVRGSEDLGNGMKLGFILESGFESSAASSAPTASSARSTRSLPTTPRPLVRAR